jgi:hypothetical protein
MKPRGAKLMYSVLIAVCLLATPAPKCARTTAVAWIVAPEDQDTIGGCMRHGMLYAASSGVVRAGSYSKIFCSAEGKASASNLPQ